MMKPVQLPHRFVEQQRNDAAVYHPSAALILPAKAETPHDFPPLMILLKRQLHPACIRRPAAKTGIVSLRLQPLDRHSFSAPLFCLLFVLFHLPSACCVMRSFAVFSPPALLCALCASAVASLFFVRFSSFPFRPSLFECRVSTFEFPTFNYQLSPINYSYLNATIGSTRIARRAGT